MAERHLSSCATLMHAACAVAGVKGCMRSFHGGRSLPTVACSSQSCHKARGI